MVAKIVTCPFNVINGYLAWTIHPPPFHPPSHIISYSQWNPLTQYNILYSSNKIAHFSEQFVWNYDLEKTQ